MAVNNKITAGSQQYAAAAPQLAAQQQLSAQQQLAQKQSQAQTPTTGNISLYQQTTGAGSSGGGKTGGAAAAPQAAAASPMTGYNYLQGVLGQNQPQAPAYMDTQSAMGGWGGFGLSDAVLQAQGYLDQVLASRPGPFESKYADQIQSLYEQIMNRPKFSYDVNKDPLFQQYKNQYMVSGQRAMQDAMGQAAALSGGYGSSWGTTAGYQAYQNYLQQLNSIIPTLEQRAFDRYAYEGSEMRNNMTMNMDLDNIDYSRYRDTVGDWKDDRSFEYTRYRDAMQDWKDDRAFNYGVYRDSVGDFQADRAFGYGMYRDQVGDYQNDRAFGLNYYNSEADRQLTNYWNQMNYNLDTQKMYLQYADQLGGGGGGGGGGGRYSAAPTAGSPTIASPAQLTSVPTQLDAITQAAPNAPTPPAKVDLAAYMGIPTGQGSTNNFNYTATNPYYWGTDEASKGKRNELYAVLGR